MADDDFSLMQAITRRAVERECVDEKMNSYFEGSSRLEQIGIAVPPVLRRFEMVVEWPRTVVMEIDQRLDVRAFVAPGGTEPDRVMQDQWEANDLPAQAPLLHQETMVYGRGFASVLPSGSDSEPPIVRVEPTRQMFAVVDARSRRLDGVLRRYVDWDGTRRRTLYTTDRVYHLVSSKNGWTVDDRDDHGMGIVPVVMFLNNPRPGCFLGRSEMRPIIPLTDAAARSLTNLQVAQEGLAVPSRYIFGVKAVKDQNGHPVPLWEQYYTSFMTHESKDVRAGQFQAADLKNFTETVTHYGQIASSVSGLPVRYFVVTTTNPAAEGAIRADESRLVTNAERKQRSWGDGWGDVMALCSYYATGKKMAGATRVRTLWHDAGTPTTAQRSDSVQKLAAGVPILSREGAWEELGWAPDRIAREKERFDRQDADPYLAHLTAKAAAPDEVRADGAEPAPTG